MRIRSSDRACAASNLRAIDAFALCSAVVTAGISLLSESSTSTGGYHPAAAIDRHPQDADAKSGYGAGLLIQVPNRLLGGDFGVAVLFEWDERARGIVAESLDSTGLTLEQVVDRILRHIKSRL